MVQRKWIGIALVGGILLGCRAGGDRPDGTIEGPGRAEEAVAAASRAQTVARARLETKAGARALPTKRILFGDLHVHTTYSIDAFLFSLPLLAGEGAHPPADACDFARYCAAVDFFALTDHAEALTPEHWAIEKESIRQCNARAGDERSPDMVAFMGFEWTQVGRTPETHYGHKNVIYPGIADDELPARAISSTPDEGQVLFAGLDVAAPNWRMYDALNWSEYSDFLWLLDRLGGMPRCERGVSSPDLPLDCFENAPTPDLLFEKLAQWGYDVLVIPHGTTWGFYTPPGTSMDKQLNSRQHDPERQRLIEIMSGHGNSEEYRTFREFELDANGNKICPAPTPDYLPCCWQAGEIMRERCGDLAADECESRIEEAKQRVLEANISQHFVFPDARGDEWLDCGQCRDCFKPSLGYRSRESVQYTMAISNFKEASEGAKPLRFRYGFIAASDVHTARPGTGYKQYERRMMTEATGARSRIYDYLGRRGRTSGVDPQRPQRVPEQLGGLLVRDAERVASYLYPGGLAATHANGRSRKAIWDAMKRREVYGTSGPRIMLWFDLLNGPEGPAPMGSSVMLGEVPRFQVRAVGSLKQKPGCPDESVQALDPARLERLCRGECYHPGDTRHPIVAIEVVRIRPQTEPGEEVDSLIEDPWKRFECEPDPAGCAVTFEDPEYSASGRDVLYYARALQEPTPAVNGANLRTEFDSQGNALQTSPCYGDYRTPFDDDCLAPVQERAWSSPIFLDQAPPSAPEAGEGGDLDGATPNEEASQSP
jgi:hypothetical protein